MSAAVRTDGHVGARLRSRPEGQSCEIAASAMSLRPASGGGVQKGSVSLLSFLELCDVMRLSAEMRMIVQEGLSEG